LRFIKSAGLQDHWHTFPNNQLQCHSSEASLPILPNTAFSFWRAQAFCLSVCRSLSDSGMVSKWFYVSYKLVRHPM